MHGIAENCYGIVLDESKRTPSHAAHQNEDNAIYKKSCDGMV
jgi:hypothetical protein